MYEYARNNMKVITVFFGFALFLMVSCGVNERVIDNYDEKTQVFFFNTNQPERLGIINLPSGATVSEDIYFAKNNERLPGKIENVVSFRDILYVFIPDSNKIVLTDVENYEKILIIDFSADSLEPIDICFPNSTDGYIIFRNKPVVHLLDITTNIVARKIDIDGIAADIDCAGNQVFVALPGKNLVSVIDSRTHKQEAVIGVNPVPSFIGISHDGKYAFVVSLGYGKTDGMQKSPAILSFVDISTRQVTKTFEISSASSSAIDEVPVGIAVSTDRMLFLATRENFYRMDYKSASSLIRVRKEKYESIEYNRRKEQIIFLGSDANKKKAIIADPKTGVYNSTLVLPSDIEKIISL